MTIAAPFFATAPVSHIGIDRLSIQGLIWRRPLPIQLRIIPDS